jgi:hypothetical protein
MNTNYTVAIKNADGEITTGVVYADSLDGQSAEDFIGEIITIKAKSENGETEEISGVLVEVLETNDY